MRPKSLKKHSLINQTFPLMCSLWKQQLQIHFKCRLFLAYVAKPVVLQMGHKFLCVNHCLIHSLWKSCPQSSVPMSSPSVYSSCYAQQNGKTVTFKWNKPERQTAKLWAESYLITWHIQQGSDSIWSSLIVCMYLHCFILLNIFSTLSPVQTLPIRSSKANSSCN